MRNFMKKRIIVGSFAIISAALFSINFAGEAIAQSTTYDMIESGQVSGLYRTGVSADGQKLPQNVDDPHWIIDRVYRPGTQTNATCQNAHRGSTTLAPLPKISSEQPIPARTILERGGQAGLITSRDKAVTGDATGIDDGVKASEGVLPWKFTVTNARWIGQNYYGQNSTQRGCRDPTDRPSRIMANANIYVFKLKDGFTFSEGVDVSSVRLKLSAAVDNSLKVVVNGQTIPARLTPSLNTNYRDVNEPGFSRNSPSVETRPAQNIFRPDGQRNELELHVQSTYSHTGLLIKDVEALATRVEPTADYNIIPSIELSKAIVQPEEQISASPKLTNNGTTRSADVTWQSTRFVVAPGRSTPAGAENSNDPIGYYGNGAVIVVQGNSVVEVGAQSLSDSQSQTEEIPAGSKICYTLSVRPFTSTSGVSWRHSQPVCAVVGKKPLVQIHGGDLKVGGALRGETSIPNLSSIVSTTNTIRSGKTYGSWVEYGITANGSVVNTASASGLAAGSSETGQSDWSKLTFANMPEFGQFGVTQRPIPDITGSVVRPGDIASAPRISGAVQITSATRGLRVANSDVTLNGYTFTTPGQTVVIYAPDSAVTVADNITYGAAALRSAEDIPQLIIIADTIKIQSNVTQLDAWLIADGTDGVIDTCADVARLSTSVCNRTLTINGPVVSKKLLLKRTAGSDDPSDTGRSSAAETFNLRPDAYLWAYSYSNSEDRVLTTHTSELPPRF